MTGDTPDNGALARAALGYAHRGIHIFPLWHAPGGLCQCRHGAACPKPGKHPRTPHGLKDATAHPGQVAAWWTQWPHAPIGLATQPNKIGVIDVDPRHGGDHTFQTLADYCATKGVDLTHTYAVRTGSGGMHWYFRDPLGQVPTKAETFGDNAPGVDTRGRGGYVIAPPSAHASGGIYQVASERGTVAAPWPGILTRLLERPRHNPPTTAGTAASQRARNASPTPASTDKLTRRLQAWAASGYARELADLAATGQGARNQALNTAAYKAGLRLEAGLLPGMNETRIKTELHTAVAHWFRAGFTRTEFDATVQSGLTAGTSGKGWLKLPDWAAGWTPDTAAGRQP